MSGPAELVLTTFEPALDELARRVDAGSDPTGTVNAALALFQGIAATALLPGGIPGIAGNPADSRWDGVFEEGRLSLIRPGYQFSATLGVGLLQTAILNGPAYITWSILRSEKGLHVTVKSPTGGTLHDLFIGLTGEVRDERDTAGKLRRMKEEFDEINRRPIESLPNGIPVGGVGEMLGQAAKGAAVAAAGAVLAAAAGAAVRAVSSVTGGEQKAGPPAPPPPAPRSVPPAHHAAPAPAPASRSAGPQTAPATRGRAPKLVFRLPDGRPLDVSSFPAVLGRSDDVEIKLESTRVSRRHAQVEQDGDGFWLTDLGSANGSFRNDVQLTSRTRLENGDRLRFADVLVQVVIEGEPVPAAGLATMAFQVPAELRLTPPAAPKSSAAPPPPAPSPARVPVPAPAPVSSPVPPPISEPPPPTPRKKTPCPACGHRCPPEASFCRACGAPLSDQAACAGCGKPLRQSDPFCDSCGTPVTAPQASPATPQPAAPSLSLPGFLFGVLFTVQLGTLAGFGSWEILFQVQVLKTIALGYSFAAMAFITGARGGFFRFVTLLLSLAYCYSGVLGLGKLLPHLASGSGIPTAIGAMVLTQMLSLLSAFWILKRSFSFPK